MIPPTTRRRLNTTLTKTFNAAKTLGSYGGKFAWAATTSTMLVLIPFALAYVEEQGIVEQEKEMKAQEAAREGLTPGIAGGEKGGAAAGL